MAYIALPTRDSSFLLLANAAPRLPRSSCVTTSALCSLVDGAPVRPMRIHSSALVSATLRSNFNPRGRRMFASVEGSVTVEEPAVSGASEETSEEKAPAEEVSAVGKGTDSSDAPAKTLERSNTVKRQAAGAKREITVTAEQLVAGAVFTGKVRAVQSYGAFVDFGAFTDGLVHISQLSSEFVKEVSDVVTVGQEVSVTVVEVNEQAGRIALSMRDAEGEAERQASRSGGESSAGSGVQGDGIGKPMNRGKIAGRGGGNARASSRSSDDRKATKLKRGQELKGTVKNIIRNGAFIAFAEEGEEGFLRGSEITEGGENVAVDSLLTVGQEVTVRVLKIERGKAALTMKPQVDMTSINDSLNTNVGAGGASNPFATFFRSANLVPAASPAASVDAQEEVPGPTVEEAPVAAVEEETPVAAVEDTPVAVVEEDTPVAAAEEDTPVAAAEEDTPVAAAEEETSAVLETPAAEEASETEETPAPAVDEKPAVEETPSTEAAQKSEEAAAVEEKKDESSKAEEPHSLSLGEIAEEIGGAVAEIEKVVEAAAGTVRNNVGS